MSYCVNFGHARPKASLEKILNKSNAIGYNQQGLICSIEEDSSKIKKGLLFNKNIFRRVLKSRMAKNVDNHVPEGNHTF